MNSGSLKAYKCESPKSIFSIIIILFLQSICSKSEKHKHLYKKDNLRHKFGMNFQETDYRANFNGVKFSSRTVIIIEAAHSSKTESQNNCKNPLNDAAIGQINIHFC